MRNWDLTDEHGVCTADEDEHNAEKVKEMIIFQLPNLSLVMGHIHTGQQSCISVTKQNIDKI
jgi:hypothetical protein